MTAVWNTARGVVALLLLAGGGGCAALLGREQLPERPFRPAPETRLQTYGDGVAELQATWRGPGGYVVTARQDSGRIARFVNPFGVDVTCVEATVKAVGGEAVTVLPDEATLQVGLLPPRKALNLQAYRRRWPRWAVTDEAQEVDRKAAYEHVLGHLWIERRLEPGEARLATFSFPADPLAGSPVLRVPYRTDRRKGVLRATWEVD